MFSYLVDDYNLNANLSKGTKQAYLMDLGSFFDFIVRRNHLKGQITSESNELSLFNSITKIDIYAYIDYLKDEKNNTSKTIARKVSAVKSLFKYLYNADKIDSDNIVSFKYKYVNQPDDIKVLSDDKIKELISYVNTFESDRNKLIIYFILFCGLTVTDLQNIKNSDLYDDTIIIYKDTEKEKIIKINDALRAILSRFIISYECSYLLNPSNNQPISKRTLQSIIKRTLSKIGISGKGISSGILRNTSIYMVQKYSDVNYTKLKSFTGLKTDNQIKRYILDEEESNIISAEELNKNPFSKLK